MIKMTTVLKIICLIALAIVGCGTFELLQFGKAIQEETRIRLQKEKDNYLGLEFEGVVVEKKYNVFVKKNEDEYSVTLLLHQIEPKPSFPYNSNIYFDYTCDSLLTIHIPQNVYNQIKEGDTYYQTHTKISLEKVCCINKKSLEKVYLCRRNSFEKMSC